MFAKLKGLIGDDIATFFDEAATMLIGGFYDAAAVREENMGPMFQAPPRRRHGVFWRDE